MQQFSLHTHTIGFDGQNTEEQMLERAVELGWDCIGFSNHFIVHPRIKNTKMYEAAQKRDYHHIYSASFEEAVAKFEEHYKRIDELRKKSPIPIFKGMEVDFFAYPQWAEGFATARKHLKPDYLIGSAHFVEHDGTLYNSHDIKNSTKIEQQMLLYRYWQNERAAAQSGLFDILAHLDLMKKVGLEQNACWMEQKTIDTIKKAGVIVELNTSYFKFGQEPYPSPRIMQMLAKENIPVIISDDAHNINQLGWHFEETKEQALQCGIKTFKRPENLQEKIPSFLIMNKAGRDL